MSEVSTRGRRAGRPSGDDRESAILATAERLLAERSLGDISIDDLARGAGISRPTFYFYFASKNAVLLTLLDRVSAEADTAAAGALGAVTGGDPRTCWRAVIRMFYETFRGHRTVTLAAAQARETNAEVRQLWAAVTEGWVSRTAAAIESERARGAAPAGAAARDLAIVLVSMNERVMHATLSGHEPSVSGENVVDVLLDAWLGTIYHTVTPA